MSNLVNPDEQAGDDEIHGTPVAELQARAAEVADQLGLLANSSRLMVLCQLLEGERSVGQLQEVAELSQSALSQHLARMREAGIVATRREAQTIHYRLEDSRVRAVIAALY